LDAKLTRETPPHFFPSLLQVIQPANASIHQYIASNNVNMQSGSLTRLNSTLDECVDAAGLLSGALVDVAAVTVAQELLQGSQTDIERTDTMLANAERGLVRGNQKTDLLVGLCSVVRPTRAMLDTTLDTVIASTADPKESNLFAQK
jgi:hypothetical protein